MNKSLWDFMLFVEVSLEDLFVHGISESDADSVWNIKELKPIVKETNYLLR